MGMPQYLLEDSHLQLSPNWYRLFSEKCLLFQIFFKVLSGDTFQILSRIGK